MRGLWDNEQTLSPGLLRSAIALLGGFMAALAAVNALLGAFAIVDGRYGPALTLFTAGLGLPFAVWLVARILADIVVMQNRTHDRIAALAGTKPPVARSHAHPQGANAGRASDDGPVYPVGE